MKWDDNSAVVLGLILDGRINVSSVRPEIFIPPYDKCVKLLQKKPDMQIEELIQTTGLSHIQNAYEQVHRLNGLGEKNWVRMLEESALLYEVGDKMERYGKKMMQGDKADLAQLKGMLIDIEENNAQDFVKMTDVTDEAMPFIKTGWKAFDNHLGGIPAVGMVILGGLPGSGKTTAVGRFATSFVKEHPDKKVALFSLEMMAVEVVPRIRSLVMGQRTEEQLSRILVCDKPLNVSEIIGRASSIDGLGLIIIDFIDWAIDGEINEQSTTLAYSQLAKAAKNLHIPILVIAQLNDLTGMPKPRNIRWSRLAWGLAWMVLMIYDPSVNWSNDSDDERYLPIVDGEAYIIAWKCRGGFRVHPTESPGAISIPFDGTRGWNPNEGKWFSLKKMG